MVWFEQHFDGNVVGNITDCRRKQYIENGIESFCYCKRICLGSNNTQRQQNKESQNAYRKTKQFQCSKDSAFFVDRRIQYQTPTDLNILKIVIHSTYYICFL